MTDVFSKEKRSIIMSKIGSKDTKPELIIRKLIFRMGYRYRLHQKDLPGKPDLVFSKRKKVIFINGCFWHGHQCKKAALPTTNSSFWKGKITLNIERDQKNYDLLAMLGWKCLIIWQCDIKKSNFEELSKRIQDFLE